MPTSGQHLCLESRPPATGLRNSKSPKVLGRVLGRAPGKGTFWGGGLPGAVLGGCSVEKQKNGTAPSSPPITAGFLYRAGAEAPQTFEKNSEFLPERFCQEWPRQTKPKKGQFMNFSRGRSGTKGQCESCLFSKGKTPEFRKMGEIHELFVLALCLVWFAGATPDSEKFLSGGYPNRNSGIHR